MIPVPAAAARSSRSATAPGLIAQHATGRRSQFFGTAPRRGRRLRCAPWSRHRFDRRRARPPPRAPLAARARTRSPCRSSLAILLGTGCAGRGALEVAAALLDRGSTAPSCRLASRPAVGGGPRARGRARQGGSRWPPRSSWDAGSALSRRRRRNESQGPADVSPAVRPTAARPDGGGVPRAGAGQPEPGAAPTCSSPAGILNSSLVHPREVFRAAIAEAAAGIIVVHNHPERRSHPLGRRPGRHPPAGGRRAAARPARLRPRDRRRRALREFCGGRACCRTRRFRHPPRVTTAAPTLAPELAKAVAPLRERLDLDLLTPGLCASAPAPTRARSASRARTSCRTAWRWRRFSPSSRWTRPPSRRPCCTTWWRTPTSRSTRSRREFGAEVADLVDGLTKMSALTFRSAEEAAGGELPQAAALDRQGRAGHHHQARRPAAQHAHARAPVRGEAAAHRAGDAGDLRAARAPLRHGGDEGRSSRIWRSSSSSRRTTGACSSKVRREPRRAGSDHRAAAGAARRTS